LPRPPARQPFGPVDLFWSTTSLGAIFGERVAPEMLLGTESRAVCSYPLVAAGDGVARVLSFT
jgi:hypothetical protein